MPSKNSSTFFGKQDSLFEDRIEITNLGCLPFGLSFEAALSGISQLRNRVIGRIFRELNLIEQGGSGLGRMINICEQQGIPLPKFEELGNFFRTTLYHSANKLVFIEEWHKPIVEYLKIPSSRLKKMCEERILVKISTGRLDPQKKFSLRITLV